jgi:hypothetical protein
MDYLVNLHPIILYPCTLLLIVGLLPVIFAVSVMTFLFMNGFLAEMLEIPDDDHDSLYRMMVLAVILIPFLVIIYILIIGAVISVTGYSIPSRSQLA